MPHDPSSFSDEHEFAFRHNLIRDGAYDSLPKSLRADKHAGVARWAEQRAGDRAEEIAELIATHELEALGYLEELGETGARARADRVRARLGGRPPDVGPVARRREHPLVPRGRAPGRRARDPARRPRAAASRARPGVVGPGHGRRDRARRASSDRGVHGGRRRPRGRMGERASRPAADAAVAPRRGRAGRSGGGRDARAARREHGARGRAPSPRVVPVAARARAGGGTDAASRDRHRRPRRTRRSCAPRRRRRSRCA